MLARFGNNLLFHLLGHVLVVGEALTVLSATAGHGPQVRGVGMHDARGNLCGYHLGVTLGLRSHHATAPHRKIAEDVAQGFLGSPDLHLQDGLDKMRLRIHEGLAEGVFACDLEGHVLGIDRVLFAVIEIDFHITDLVAREDAVALGGADSFLDRRDEVPIDVVAHQRMTKLDAAVARERIDAHPDLRELAGTSTLFLVAVLRFSFRVDGFAVGNARLFELDIDVVAPSEGFRDSLEMNLSLSREDGLLQFGIHAELEGGIFLVNDGQAFRHLLLVTPGRQPKGGVDVWCGIFDPGQAGLQFRAAEGVVGVSALEFDQSPDLSRLEVIRCFPVLAVGKEDLADTLVLAGVDVVEGVPRFEFSRVDPEE